MKDLVTERLKLKDLYPERAEALAKEHKIDVEDLELVRKGIVAEKAEVDKDERSVTSYINTGTKDRDNEILEPEGAILSYYRKNPVVPYGHDYRGLPVGKNIWIKKDKKGLIAKTVFLKHQFADDVYCLYSEDVAGTGPAMKGWSVGFIPLKWEGPDGEVDKPKEGEQDTRLRRTYKKWELMEYSAVMIPSNREALTEMVEKGAIKSDKLKKDIGEFIEIDDKRIRQEMEEIDEEYDRAIYDLDSLETEDLITKPEETDDFIRIPVRDCKVTATITISEKEGITALYCGKIKKIRTYIFNKKPPYNWTMAKAKKWVEEHGKAVQGRIDLFNQLSYFEFPDDGFEQLEEVVNMDSQKQLEELVEKAKYNCECIKCGWKHTSEKHCNTYKCEKCGGTMRRVGRPGPGQESVDEGVIELEDDEENLKGVVPYKKYPFAPDNTPWHGIAERSKLKDEKEKLPELCVYVFTDEPDKLTSYIGMHHHADNKKTNWHAVTHTMAVLFGARGDYPRVPAESHKGMYNHLAKHYKDHDTEPPEWKEYTEEELKEIFPEDYEQTVGEVTIKIRGDVSELEADLERIRDKYKEIADINWGKFAEEIQPQLIETIEELKDEVKALKEGRVLSAKNRKLVKQCADMLMVLYEATEPPQREEFELEVEEGKKEPKKAKDNKVEIDRDSLIENIASIIKNRIGDMVQSAINKARGKVE